MASLAVVIQEKARLRVARAVDNTVSIFLSD